MTTSGRPTVESARGGEHQGGRLYVPSQAFSKRDVPGHTVLKLRQPGQDTEADLASRDLAAELRAREAAQAASTRTSSVAIPAPETKPRPIDADEDLADEDEDEDDTSAATAAAPIAQVKEEDEEDEDEDDTAELLAELERIKQERVTEQKRKQAAEAANAERARDAAAATGNPLLQPPPGIGVEATTTVTREAPADFVVRKKWYDDTVFRNQSRGEPEPRRRFVNDTVRNDFHLKFLRKYMQ